MITTSDQQNGQPHTNNTRNTYNNRVGRYIMLGTTKKVQWDGRRRNRSI